MQGLTLPRPPPFQRGCSSSLRPCALPTTRAILGPPGRAVHRAVTPPPPCLQSPPHGLPWSSWGRGAGVRVWGVWGTRSRLCQGDTPGGGACFQEGHAHARGGGGGGAAEEGGSPAELLSAGGTVHLLRDRIYIVAKAKSCDLPLTKVGVGLAAPSPGPGSRTSLQVRESPVKGGRLPGQREGRGLGGRTCERVPAFVVQAADCRQHLLLGAEGVQVPLGLGVSTVLGQAWKGGSGQGSPRRAGSPLSTEDPPARPPRSWQPHWPHGGPTGAQPGSCRPHRSAESSAPATVEGPQGRGPGPTNLDFIRPDFKGLDDAGQEVFDLLEVAVADTPGPVHQEDHVRGGGGCAAELGAGWAGRGGVRCGQGRCRVLSSPRPVPNPKQDLLPGEGVG